MLDTDVVVSDLVAWFFETGFSLCSLGSPGTQRSACTREAAAGGSHIQGYHMET